MLLNFMSLFFTILTTSNEENMIFFKKNKLVANMWIL